VISFVSDAVSPMKKAIFARSRGRKGNYWQNRLRLFPNQALYQAEPQPELKETRAADAPFTSRILPQIARNSKIMEHLQGATALAAVFPSMTLRHYLAPVESAVVLGRIWILRVEHLGRPVAARINLAPKAP
jgi:hypothetical protein